LFKNSRFKQLRNYADFFLGYIAQDKHENEFKGIPRKM